MAKILKIKWLERAITSLDNEAIYLADIHPKLARKMVAQVLKQIYALKSQAHIGHPGRIPGTRELTIDNYLYVVTYRVKNTIIEILEIYNTA